MISVAIISFSDPSFSVVDQLFVNTLIAELKPGCTLASFKDSIIHDYPGDDNLEREIPSRHEQVLHTTENENNESVEEGMLKEEIREIWKCNFGKYITYRHQQERIQRKY